MTDKKVLLIGGGGFIGTWLGTRFMADGWQVTVLDDFRNKGLDHYEDCLIKVVDSEGPVRHLITQSLLDMPGTEDVLLDLKPDVVVYLAGASTVEDASTPEAFQSSNRALLNALDACMLSDEENHPHFVYISSSMVYGDFEYDYEPLTESHPLNPVNMYGAMKVTGEKLVEISGLPYTIIRPTAVYGAYDSHDRVIKKFCEAALLGHTLKVYGDGKLDFTHVSDVANGIFLAATKPDPKALKKLRVYNISAGHAISLLEAAQVVGECSPREVLIAHHENDIDLDRPKRGALDTRRAKRDLGYSPKAVFKDEVQRYINEHLAPKWEGAVIKDPKYYVYKKETRKSA